MVLSPQWDFLYWWDGIFIFNQDPGLDEQRRVSDSLYCYRPPYQYKPSCNEKQKMSWIFWSCKWGLLLCLATPVCSMIRYVRGHAYLFHRWQNWANQSENHQPHLFVRWKISRQARAISHITSLYLGTLAPYGTATCSISNQHVFRNILTLNIFVKIFCVMVECFWKRIASS